MGNPAALENFQRIKAGIDIRSFVAEILANEHLWLLDKRRQDRIYVQRETNTIPLRGADTRGRITANVNEIHECITTQQAAKFPFLMHFLQAFARDRDAKLQRAMIVRLKPNGRVYPHIDAGSYYIPRDRFHLVLISSYGSRLTSGRESAIFREGELWWFNNKLIHSSANDSRAWRVHVIFDLLPSTQARSNQEILKEGGNQMSDDGNPSVARANNGNGDIVPKDNGNGSVASGNMHHSYSFEINHRNFSLRVQLEFRADQITEADNGNGGVMPDHAETLRPVTNNGNGSVKRE
jgi:hypothetical protein